MSRQHCLFLQVMETGRNPTWEQDGQAPIRVHGQEDGGGAPGPSTSKGEWALVPQKIDKLSNFWPPHVGLGDAPKGTSLGLGGGVHYFSRVVLVASMLRKAIYG